MYGNHNTKARGGKMVKYFCKVKTTNVTLKQPQKKMKSVISHKEIKEIT